MKHTLFGKRTSFKFTPLAVRQLDDLKRRARLPKDSDVLIAAIDVLAQLLEWVLAGDQIFLQSADRRQMWPYTPYAPPIDYPHFPAEWRQLDDKGPKERRTFAFTGNMVDRVATIKASSRFQSESDVVRASIAVFHELLCVVGANDRIILRNSRGADRPFNPLTGASAKLTLAPTARGEQPSAREMGARRKKRRVA